MLELNAQKDEWQSQITQLQSQLAEGESALYQSKVRFPDEVESIEYAEELFMIAHAFDLEVVDITATAPHEQEVEDTGIIYSITTIEVQVSPPEAPPIPLTIEYLDDSVANMLDFIDAIVNGGYFTTANIEEVILDIPEICEEEKPLAIIELNIYSYEGE